MPDETAHVPDWLVALHCPICGDVKLSRDAWKAPEHVPEILGGFGPRHPPARRYIVLKIDRMADDHWFARNQKPAFGLQEAKVHFASSASAAKNLLNKLQEPDVRRAILMAARRKQIRQDGPKWLLGMDLVGNELLDADLAVRTPLDEIDLVLEIIREGAEEVLRDPDLYYRPLGRRVVDNRKKHLERALLWEPLLDLMHEFGIEDFGKYQDLIQTVRSLHLAVGIHPPDDNYLKQVVLIWKRRLNSAA